VFCLKINLIYYVIINLMSTAVNVTMVRVFFWLIAYLMFPVSVLGLKACLKLKLIYDRQSVCQSVVVSGAHLGPMNSYSFSFKVPLESRGFVIL
jgi:hypothetical protein